MFIGHDAEFAVLDKNGRAVPAHRFFPPKGEAVLTGYYKRSEYLKEDQKGYHLDQYFRDGSNLEVNTPGNISCCAYMLNSTALTLEEAKKRLPAGHRLHAVSAYDLKIDPEDAPPDVLEIGCSPAKNAYRGWQDYPSEMDPLSELRAAGGHMHFSSPRVWEAPTGMLRTQEAREKNAPFVIKMLDLYTAVPVIYMGLEGGAGRLRRMFYGKAGEYRFQQYNQEELVYTRPPGFDPYEWPAKSVPKPTMKVWKAAGLEYRVLGPEWLRDGNLAAFTMMTARKAVRAAENRIKAKTMTFDEGLLRDAVEGINAGDTEHIFKNAKWRAEFQRVLGADEKGPITIKHWEFFHEMVKDGMFRETNIPAGHEWHDSFPQCISRFGGIMGQAWEKFDKMVKV